MHFSENLVCPLWLFHCLPFYLSYTLSFTFFISIWLTLCFNPSLYLLYLSFHSPPLLLPLSLLSLSHSHPLLLSLSLLSLSHSHTLLLTLALLLLSHSHPLQLSLCLSSHSNPILLSLSLHSLSPSLILALSFSLSPSLLSLSLSLTLSVSLRLEKISGFPFPSLHGILYVQYIVEIFPRKGIYVSIEVLTDRQGC